MSLAPAPVTFETWTNAALDATLRAQAHTSQNSVSGVFDAGSLGNGFTFSSHGSTALNSTGGGTTINESSPPNSAEILTDIDKIVVTWIYGGGGFSQTFQQTIETDFIGTSDTAVIFTIGFADDSVTAFGTATTNGETLASESQTSATFKQWSTTNLAVNITTTQSSDTQQTFWTHQTTSNGSDAEWITSSRAASTQGTTLKAGTSQIITSYNTTVTFEPEEARSTKKITRSTATYNTLILASSTTPNALTTTESADPQKQSGITAFYGGLTLNDGTAGYTTSIRTTTESGTISWSGTQTSNRPSAGISFGANPPRVVEGQVIATAGGGTRTQQTTTTQEAIVLTHGEITTSLASFETMALGPAQTTRSFSVSALVDTFVEGGSFDINLGVPAGFSMSVSDADEYGAQEAGVFVGGVEGYEGIADIQITNSNSITASALAVTLSPRAGFTSSIAALQTSRINTLKFAVVGAGDGSGITYADTAFLNAITAKSLIFAPKSAQEYLPVSGSASSSSGQTTFSMSYYGTRQSRTSTIGTDTNSTVTSETSAWSATGSPQTHWVHVSRGQVAGAPAFPTIPALIVAGTGQALLTNGLYETYSGNGSDRSSDSTWSVSVNRVTSFAESEGVTAIKPLQYFPFITGTNAQTTSASFANNLTAQPLDD
jgi:hypothetical protein